jgi:hypothetical protein
MNFYFIQTSIEGSRFSKEELLRYLEKAEISGTHRIDDIFATINSVELFDFVMDTLSKKLILEFQAMLKKNTNLAKYNLTGFKKIQNFLLNIDLKLAEPFEIEEKLEELITTYEQPTKEIRANAQFHAKFELIPPL